MNIKNAYNLIKYDNQYLVLSTDYRRFDEYVIMLTTDLTRLEFQGYIIIDLLLSNGDGQSRFFEAYFDGVSISNTSLRKKTDICIEILDVSFRFYSQNLKLIEHSVLSTGQVENFFSRYP